MPAHDALTEMRIALLESALSEGVSHAGVALSDRAWGTLCKFTVKEARRNGLLSVPTIRDGTALECPRSV